MQQVAAAQGFVLAATTCEHAAVSTVCIPLLLKPFPVLLLPAGTSWHSCREMLHGKNDDTPRVWVNRLTSVWPV